MKILALIPARGGSKGVLKKNIRPFNGRPLIAYTIEAAKASKYVDRIVVSTEDEEIAAIAIERGADVPFIRPIEMASDTSKVMDAVVYTLEKLKEIEGYEPTHVLLLQTTSPMRTSEDIDHAVELFEARSAESLVSVCQTESWLLMKDAEDRLTILPNGIPLTSNRQQNPKFYKLDGCMIYLIKTDVLLHERSFVAGKLIGYEIPRWRAIDIDDPQDFVVGELIHRERGAIEQALKDFS